MKLGAAIETGSTGFWYGRFIELPGSHARAESLKQLYVELMDEAHYHDAWLGSHGERQLGTDDMSFSVMERVEGLEMLGESGGTVALFQFDLKEPSRAYIERCLRYMDYHRDDLLNLVGELDDDTLNHTPQGKGRNITQILGHICNAEEWYISRLGAEADPIYEKNLGITVDEADNLPIFERMRRVRRACTETLQEVIPGKAGILSRAEYTSYPDERWTARKVLRRFLEHEREHIYNIRWYQGREIRSIP